MNYRSLEVSIYWLGQSGSIIHFIFCSLLLQCICINIVLRQGIDNKDMLVSKQEYATLCCMKIVIDLPVALA